MREVEMLEPRWMFNAGALQSSFGTGGSTRTILGTQAALASGQIIAEKNGQFVAVGYGSSNGQDMIDLVRYNANGSLDTSFGVGGIAVVEPGGGLVRSIAAAPDGAIYVGIDDANPTPPPIDTSHVFRLTSAGDIDTTFASDGELTLAPYVRLEALAVGKDGKLVIASQKETDPGGVTIFGIDPSEIVVQRYTLSGMPDSTFGTDGEIDTPVGSENIPTAIALQRDGKTIVAGYVSSGSLGRGSDFVVRYKADGTLDPSYGKAGIFSGSMIAPQSMALASNGQVILSSVSSTNQIIVEKLTTRGRLEGSFGNKGVALLQMNADLVNATTSVVVDSAGKIVVGTEETLAMTGTQTILTRFNPAGKPDTHFGESGSVATTFDDPGTVTGIVESGDKIVTAGDINLGTVNTVKQLVLVAYRK